MYTRLVKPIADFFAALIGLIILSPLFILITILLFIANNGKPFFTQKRPGKNGAIFKIVKFKTMNDKKDANGQLLTDGERLTAVGSLVRKTSLDEIPQLINVLLGDMSIVGPRPLLPAYLEHYTPFQNRRHEVKPGITGWAQVNGRNTISWDQKFEYDVWYVNHQSFNLDIRIIIKTIQKVMKASGISPGDQVTMSRFDDLKKKNI
jgi:lipopolysaccharide/colanic/teichoic acid biosynthesis glycosyltransferase